MIAKRLQPGMRVLDLGAGPGKDGPVNFAHTGVDVVGVDPDSAIASNQRVHYRVLGTAERLPFRRESFDLVYCDWVAEHLKEPSVAVGEVLRILKPGGAFLFRTGNRRHYVFAIAAHTPHWFHRLAANRVRKLSDESVEPYPTYYRINTVRAVRDTLAAVGFEQEELLTIEPEPSYLVFSVPSFLFGVAYERLVNRFDGLAGLRDTLLGCFRKPSGH
jgi:ubiquinone/menaquinone biosynthesis C-methylase UbiE